jgi:hypothetical protein
MPIATLAPVPEARSEFAFVIPMKPRRACVDWEQAQANLRRTIRSIDAGSRRASAIVIACHDAPRLEDDRQDVHVLTVPFPEPADKWEGGRDKARKRRHAGAWLRSAMTLDRVYAMFLDADDLVHRDVVSHVHAHGHGSYLVEKGYILDVAAGLLELRPKGFHLTCGSSFVCRFARDELPKSWEDDASPYGQFGASPDQRGHMEYDKLAAELGRPAAPFPFPAVVYTVNHSESLSLAKRDGLLLTGQPRDLLWPVAARRVLEEGFAAHDLAGTLAGRAVVGRRRVRAFARRARSGATRRLRSLAGRAGL